MDHRKKIGRIGSWDLTNNVVGVDNTLRMALHKSSRWDALIIKQFPHTTDLVSSNGRSFELSGRNKMRFSIHKWNEDVGVIIHTIGLTIYWRLQSYRCLPYPNTLYRETDLLIHCVRRSCLMAFHFTWSYSQTLCLI